MQRRSSVELIHVNRVRHETRVQDRRVRHICHNKRIRARAHEHAHLAQAAVLELHTHTHIHTMALLNGIENE